MCVSKRERQRHTETDRDRDKQRQRRRAETKKYAEVKQVNRRMIEQMIDSYEEEREWRVQSLHGDVPKEGREGGL